MKKQFESLKESKFKELNQSQLINVRGGEPGDGRTGMNSVLKTGDGQYTYVSADVLIYDPTTGGFCGARYQLRVGGEWMEVEY